MTESSDATAPLTREIAAFAASLGKRSVPEEALPVVRLGFTDCIGVMLAGSSEPASRAVRAFAEDEAAAPRARLLLGERRSSPRLAALVNATAAHALDWDDYAFVNHPSAVLVPTILACADAAGGDGPLMCAAYLGGYETWAALMEREPDQLHARGWHPTGLFGPIGAAIAAAIMLRLDEAQIRHAVAIAASHAGGVMANFGTSTKPYHGGKAAEAGVAAALLARHGLAGGAAAIEDRLGLLAAISPHGRADRASPMRLGESWRFAKYRLNIKKYPTVGASQRTIDSVLAAAPVDPAEVRSLHPLISVKQAAVMNFHRPQTALEAKFSLEFATASAVLHRRVGLRELSDASVCDPAMQAMMSKVVLETTDIYDPDYTVAAPTASVRIVLDDGTEITTPPIRRASGHADIPLTTEALWAKFEEGAAAGGLAQHQARVLFDRLQNVDRLGAGDALTADMA